MSIETEKADLQAKFDQMKVELDKAQRRLEKLNKVQDLQEPGPGTVLRFSRPMAGSNQKYTFVAFRSGRFPQSWHLTGKANALRLLGLAEGANTWENLLVAIGDAPVSFATEWSNNPVDTYEYFRGVDSGKIFRFDKSSSASSAVQVKYRQTGRWHISTATPRSWLENNPGSYKRITAEEANSGAE